MSLERGETYDILPIYTEFLTMVARGFQTHTVVKNTK